MSTSNILKSCKLVAGYEYKVPFCDIDAMKVVWNGYYLRYFDIARDVLLDSIGFEYDHITALKIRPLVVENHIIYRKAIKLDQEIMIYAGLEELSFNPKVLFEIRDKTTNILHAQGYTNIALIHAETNQPLLEVPDIIKELYAKAVAKYEQEHKEKQ